MSSTPASQRSSLATRGGPYLPHNIGPGGTPDVLPDVPISVVFLVLYLIFGIIHIKILKNNKRRGHKFVFNGAILGLCKIRVIAMCLRIAWACHPRNLGLAIAANTFVYIGTIILYLIDWFFVQRIVRAQHTKIGWSTPYRVFHRAGIAGLVITLILLIIGSISGFFTLDPKKIQVFHAFFVTGETYFTVFCFLPAVLVVLSLLIPRHEVEKFGAGRLRINISILLVAVAVLMVGQVFRCVLAWIPPTPLRNAHGQPVAAPWYLQKACFYVFSFVTEIIVIIMFALVRVDLRFHVPNGSKIAGDYSAHNSRYTVNEADSESEKDIILPPAALITHQNNSSETLHHYETSVFDDTKALADSLKYGSSTLELDDKTGNWKVKRVSTSSTSSRTSLHSSRASRSSIGERTTPVHDEIPPVPEIPAAWPLRDSKSPRSSVPLFPQPPSSRKGTPKNVKAGETATDALTKLEHNSEKNKLKPTTPPPHYDCCTAPVDAYKPTLPAENNVQQSSYPAHGNQRRRSAYPPKYPLDATRQRSETGTSCSETANTTTICEATQQPQTQASEATDALPSHATRRSSGSLEIISLIQGQSMAPRQVLDVSLQREQASTVAPSENEKEVVQEPRTGVTRPPSSRYSDVSSSDVKDFATAQEGSRRFSFESMPVSPIP